MERPVEPPMTNPRAERAKAIRSLAGRSARLRRGQFLTEGPQAVREAVLAHAEGRWLVEGLYATAQTMARYPEIERMAAEGKLPVRLATDDVIDAMSSAVSPQGIVAVVRMTSYGLSELARCRLVAILADARDPGNAGTIIRVADAAGADAVILAGSSVDPFNPKTIRATAGSMFHIPVIADVDVDDAVTAVKSLGATVLAAAGGGGHDLDDLADAAAQSNSDLSVLSQDTAWLFGNEARGLSSEELAMADHTVRIPIHGAAESLNVATAAAICMFASARAHRHRMDV